MANYRKRNGRWQVRVYVPGVGYRAKTFATKAECREWVKQQSADLHEDRWVDPNVVRSLTVAGWVEEWFEDAYATASRSHRSRSDYVIRGQILPMWGTRPLASIRSTEVQQWVNALNKKYAKATVHKNFQIARRMFRSAVSARRLTRSPCSDIRLPRLDYREPLVLSPGGVRVLVAEIHPHYRLFVQAAAMSGLRSGELSGLLAKRVDLVAATIRVVEKLEDVDNQIAITAPKTKAGIRTVPIPRHLVELLRTHMETLPDGEAVVFTTIRRCYIRRNSFRYRFWVPAVAAAHERSPGLVPADLNFHDLRHTAVSTWIQAGASPIQVKTWAGHATIRSVFDTYGHFFPDHSDPIMNAIDNWIDSLDDNDDPEPETSG